MIDTHIESVHVVIDPDEMTVWVCIPGCVRIDATVELWDREEVQTALNEYEKELV